MTIFWHSLRTSARSLMVPMIAAMLVCYVGVQLGAQGSTAGVDHTAGQWLHLPGLLLVATALAAVLDCWPPFSRARPGCAYILRVERGPLQGCGAAALGSFAALGLAFVATGLAFAAVLWLAGIPPAVVQSRIAIHAEQARPYLDNQQDSLAFRVPANAVVSRIRLRPLAIYAGPDVRHSMVRVLVDGLALRGDFRANAGEPIDLLLDPPRSISALRVERKRGPGLILRLPVDRIEILASAPRSATLNGVFAMLSYLAPAALAFAIMILGRAHLALPVNLAAGLVTCLLLTLLNLTPNSPAITAYSRGRWLPGEVPGAIGTAGAWAAIGMLAVVATARWGASTSRGSSDR